MEISNLTSYWQKIMAANSATESTTSTSTSTSGQAANAFAAYDTYIPSSETGDEILCSDNYNDIASQSRSMMPPPPPPEMSSDDSSYSNSSSSNSTSTTSSVSSIATDTDDSVSETDAALMTAFLL